jgi:hypothetical protein
MPDDLATLETQRSKLLEEFLRLSDLRPGSITAVTRRCGKPSCHCAKHNEPGHDPQFRLTCRVSGKTVTETFPNPTALRKAQQEVAEFHRFQKLSQDLVALNDKICRLRPVEQQRVAGATRKKNGCCDPSRGGVGSKSTARPCLCTTPKRRPDRSGSGRVGLANCSPPSGRRRLKRTAAIRNSSGGSASAAVPMWPSRPIPGNPLQTRLETGIGK